MKKFILKTLVKLTSNTKKGSGAIQFEYKDHYINGSKVAMIANVKLMKFLSIRWLQKYCLKKLKKEYGDVERVVLNARYNKFKNKSEFVVYCSFRKNNKRCSININF